MTRKTRAESANHTGQVNSEFNPTEANLSCHYLACQNIQQFVMKASIVDELLLSRPPLVTIACCLMWMLRLWSSNAETDPSREETRGIILDSSGSKMYINFWCTGVVGNGGVEKFLMVLVWVINRQSTHSFARILLFLANNYSSKQQWNCALCETWDPTLHPLITIVLHDRFVVKKKLVDLRFNREVTFSIQDWRLNTLWKTEKYRSTYILEEEYCGLWSTPDYTQRSDVENARYDLAGSGEAFVPEWSFLVRVFCNPKPAGVYFKKISKGLMVI